MEHPYEYRAHFNEHGGVCHCPWGIAPGNEHLGSLKIVEASKLEWLEGRPDMQSERNQGWLNFMKDGGLAHETTDKLLPWLHREFKKNRLVPALNGASRALAYLPSGDTYNPNEPLDYIVQPGTKYLELHDLRDIQGDLEEMQKRRQGIDLMQHKVHELLPKIRDFQKWQGQQKRKDYGEVLHRFPNGWTMRRLQNDREHRDEGDRMNHCVGQPQYGYSENTEKGRKIYASLRDEMNEPHATLEITPDHWKHSGTEQRSEHPYGETGDSTGWIPQIGPHSDIEQFFGPNDSDPEDEHREMVNDWLTKHGASSVGRNEAGTILVPGPETVDAYYNLYHEEGEPWEYYPDEDTDGRPRGEHTEFDYEPPYFESIADDLYRIPEEYPHDDTWKDSVDQVFDTARRSGHIPQLNPVLYSRSEQGNLDHQMILNEWERLKEPWYHPYTGEVYQGYGTPPIQEFQNRLFNEIPEGQRRPAEITPRQQYDPNNLGAGVTDLGPVQGPHQGPYIYWPRNPNLSSTKAKSLYHRWVFSPTRGVTLGSNRDDHPAFVKYHQGLSGDLNDTDLVHGYAYPIGNGWRVTDYEHKALEDPYIVNQVVRALNHNGAPLGIAEASWRPAEYDWDTLHYGMPKEVVR